MTRGANDSAHGSVQLCSCVILAVALHGLIHDTGKAVYSIEDVKIKASKVWW